MSQEEFIYTIPADGSGHAGSQVDLILTYDASHQNADGSYSVIDASGSYQTLNTNGAVVDTDQITGLLGSGGFGHPDSELFVGQQPFVDINGISFTINNNTDGNNSTGNVNVYSDSGSYYEYGANAGAATAIAEATPDLKQEALVYMIPADGSGHAGSQVDLILTYDASHQNADGSYSVIDASGSYQTLNTNGAVVDTDQITGLLGSGGFGHPDSELFVGQQPFVDINGISFTINNNADGNNSTGNVDFYSDSGIYYEYGANAGTATAIAEATPDLKQEALVYTIPADGAGHAGSQVDLILTYDASHQNADGSYSVIDASGSYQTLNTNGDVVDTDQITGLLGSSGLGHPDSELFVGQQPFVDIHGISFTINNNTDGNNSTGNVDVFSDSGSYYEDGANAGTATAIAEATPDLKQEALVYTIPADGSGHAGSQVDLILTYDASHQNADGSYSVIDASGSYQTLNTNGDVVDTDQITGLLGSSGLGHPDSELFVGQQPFVDIHGISFTINNNTDGNNSTADVNVFSDSGSYYEDGANAGTATAATEHPVCYTADVQIQTDRGEIRVADLKVGDRVRTLSGELQPIVWIGKQTLSAERARDPNEVLPIRITAGALEDNVPVRDLVVSPGHCLFIDGKLVQAEHLVNGATILREQTAEPIVYYHIELPGHDVVIADGAPAESYLDTGNRSALESLDHSRRELEAAVEAKKCAPQVVPGPDLTEIRAKLAARTESRGFTYTRDPDLHLIVDGVIVRPATGVDGVYSFNLVEPPTSVRVMSRDAVPAEVTASSRDMRRLGVALSQVVVRDEGMALAPDHRSAELADGFHPAEKLLRWTNGDAALPARLFAPFAGEVTLELHLGASTRYLLTTPAEAKPTRRQSKLKLIAA